jgi:hypothetical protein
LQKRWNRWHTEGNFNFKPPDSSRAVVGALIAFHLDRMTLPKYRREMKKSLLSAAEMISDWTKGKHAPSSGDTPGLGGR